MTSDSISQPSDATRFETAHPQDSERQVALQRKGNYVRLSLPKAPPTTEIVDWLEVWHQLKHRLNASERFWQPGTAVLLAAKDRLLDGRQLQAIEQALSEVQLQLQRVETSRRQTAVAAATAGYSVEQSLPDEVLLGASAEATLSRTEPLYLQTTVRSGVEIRHSGTVIIVGDLNPGGSIVATGDILIWGRLRGIAHAGAQGDRQCRIAALQMEPTQLRIADMVARAPATPLSQAIPEVAYISPEGIRIARAMDFLRTHRYADEIGGWTDSQLITDN